MSNQNNDSPSPNNPLFTPKLTDLELSPEDYATVALALDVASRSMTPDGEDYRLLAKLFRVMAIAAILHERLTPQAIAGAEQDLAALGLDNVFDFSLAESGSSALDTQTR